MLTNSLSKLSSAQPPNDRDDQATAFKTQFAEKAKDPTAFNQLFNDTYGDTTGQHSVEQLRQQTLQGDYSWLPSIEYVPGGVLQGAEGAYNESSQTIFINEDFIGTDHAQNIYTEEAGHHIDTLVNSVDTQGDEGALFRYALNDQSLSPELTQQLRQEDDQGVINYEGTELDVEFKTNNEVDALNTLIGHWDDINGRDSITSLSDLEKIASDNSNSELQDAAQYYIDNPDKFSELDTSGFGGDGDTKVSIEDIRARQQTLGFTPPIQQVSTHNSYEASVQESFLGQQYQRPVGLPEQFEEQGIHSFELDIHNSKIDEVNGSTDQDWSVRHFGISPHTGNLSTYLDEIELLDTNEPISLFIDLKDPLSGSGHESEDLDQLLEDKFDDRLFTPEDLLARGKEIDPNVTTLQQAIEAGAWPSEAELEGKIIVSLTGDDYIDSYTTHQSAFIAPKPKIEDGEFSPQDDAVIYNLNANPVGRTDRDEIARANQLITENGNLVRNYGVDQNSVDQLAASGANFLATDDVEGVKV